MAPKKRRVALDLARSFFSFLETKQRLWNSVDCCRRSSWSTRRHTHWAFPRYTGGIAVSISNSRPKNARRDAHTSSKGVAMMGLSLGVLALNMFRCHLQVNL